MSRKTIFITLGVFVGVLALALAAYFIVRPSGGTGSSTGEEAPIFGQLPEGGTITPSEQGSSETPSPEQGELGATTEGTRRIRLISSKPVSGFGLFSATNTGQIIRYIERESGHMFEATFANSEVKRISNTTIPKIYQASWLDKAENVVLRLLSDATEAQQTFVGHVSANGEGGSLGGTYLDEGVTSVAVDAKGKRLFFVRREAQGSAAVISTLATGKQTTIFSSPISEWQALWLGTTPLLLTNASGNTPGYLYAISESTGSLSRILGDVNGLTALPSPDGKRILYSQSIGSSIRMYVLEVATGKTLPVVVGTLPEKCVWSKKNAASLICAIPFSITGETSATAYPDAWYQGRISFSDTLWTVDATTGAAQLLYRFSRETETPFDVVNPALSPQEDQVVFQNKKDLTLWSVQISDTPSH